MLEALPAKFESTKTVAQDYCLTQTLLSYAINCSFHHALKGYKNALYEAHGHHAGGMPSGKRRG